MALLDCWWLSQHFESLWPGFSHAKLLFKVRWIPLIAAIAFLSFRMCMQHTSRANKLAHMHTHTPTQWDCIFLHQWTHYTVTTHPECLLNQQCHRTISVEWLLGQVCRKVSVSRVTHHSEQTVAPAGRLQMGGHVSALMCYPSLTMPFHECVTWMCVGE